MTLFVVDVNINQTINAIFRVTHTSNDTVNIDNQTTICIFSLFNPRASHLLADTGMHVLSFTPRCVTTPRSTQDKRDVGFQTDETHRLLVIYVSFGEVPEVTDFAVNVFPLIRLNRPSIT